MCMIVKKAFQSYITPYLYYYFVVSTNDFDFLIKVILPQEFSRDGLWFRPNISCIILIKQHRINILT